MGRFKQVGPTCGLWCLVEAFTSLNIDISRKKIYSELYDLAIFKYSKVGEVFSVDTLRGIASDYIALNELGLYVNIVKFKNVNSLNSSLDTSFESGNMVILPYDRKYIDRLNNSYKGVQIPHWCTLSSKVGFFISGSQGQKESGLNIEKKKLFKDTRYLVKTHLADLSASHFSLSNTFDWDKYKESIGFNAYFPKKVCEAPKGATLQKLAITNFDTLCDGLERTSLRGQYLELGAVR